MSKYCPKCGTEIVGHPNKRFCNSVCKDGYHNHIKAHGKGSHLYRTQDKNDGIRYVSGQCKCCGETFTGHKNKKFCDSRCKDHYHNITNPRGIFSHLNEGTTRNLTPEQFQEYKKELDEERDHNECLDAMEEGWDGHKVW